MTTEIPELTNYKSMLLRVSSEDKENTSISNSQFIININNASYRIDNVAGILVKYISCPNIFPNVPTYANTLQLIKTTGPITYDISVPVGQYTIADFIVALQLAINTAIGPDSVAITLTSQNYINFVFVGDTYTFVYANSTIADVIGLVANIGPALNITMQSLPNLQGETELYVHSKDIAPSYLVEPDGNFSVVDILPLDVPFGSTAYSKFDDDEMHKIRYTPYSSPKTLRNISIVLRNRAGQVLNLPNNFNFNMILKVFYL